MQQQQKRSIIIKYSELSNNRLTKITTELSDFLAFFGDKIAILTMKMIFYKQLAITVGVHLVRCNLWQKKKK